MTWKIYTMGDAYKERPPVRYAVEGFFEFPSVNIVYGAPSSLKSMLVLDLCMCVATGRPWLTNLEGIVPKSTTKSNVLWVDFDNGLRMTADRTKALGTHYKVAADDLSFKFVSCPSEGLNMANPKSVLDLEKAIEETQAKLVVIDNLGLVSGRTDENSNGMVPIMGAFRSLAEKHQVAFVIIHHERKGSRSHDGRPGETLRGHSSIEGALDRSFAIVREDRSNKVTVMPAKERGASIQPFSATFRFINRDFELTEGWFEGVESDNLSHRVEKVIKASLTEGQKNQSEIVQHAKTTIDAPKKTVITILERLVDTKEIVAQKGAKNATLYSLPKSEQFNLPYNKDIVRYNEEIIPSSGYVQ